MRYEEKRNQKRRLEGKNTKRPEPCLPKNDRAEKKE